MLASPELAWWLGRDRRRGELNGEQPCRSMPPSASDLRGRLRSAAQPGGAGGAVTSLWLRCDVWGRVCSRRS